MLPLQQKRQRRRRQRHILHPARKLRHRRRQPVGVAHPCAQQLAQRHPARANKTTATILLQKISRVILVRFFHPKPDGLFRMLTKKISAKSMRDSQHHTPTLRTIITEKGRCAACKHISLLLFRVYYLFLMIRCFPNPWFESTYIPCRDIC